MVVVEGGRRERKVEKEGRERVEGSAPQILADRCPISIFRFFRSPGTRRRRGAGSTTRGKRPDGKGKKKRDNVKGAFSRSREPPSLFRARNSDLSLFRGRSGVRSREATLSNWRLRCARPPIVLHEEGGESSARKKEQESERRGASLSSRGTAACFCPLFFLLLDLSAKLPPFSLPLISDFSSRCTRLSPCFSKSVMSGA